MLIARGQFEKNILSHSRVIGTKPVFITYGQLRPGVDRCTQSYGVSNPIPVGYTIYDVGEN